MLGHALAGRGDLRHTIAGAVGDAALPSIRPSVSKYIDLERYYRMDMRTCSMSIINSTRTASGSISPPYRFQDRE